MADGPRRCSASNAAGEPCRNPVVLESGYCLAHDREAAESRGFGGHQPAAGRPRVPRFHELATATLERDVTAWLAPYLAARDSGDPDLAMRAAERLLDRLHGKPTASIDQRVTGNFDLNVFLLPDPLGDTDGDDE